MNNKKPINLDLSTLKFPPMAIASILHRIAGVVMFLLLPIMLYFFGCSLHSAASFAHLKAEFLNPYVKLILWGFSSAFVYHLIAGIRHLFMDLGHGETLIQARRSAVFVVALAVISAIGLGVWIW